MKPKPVFETVPLSKDTAVIEAVCKGALKIGLQSLSTNRLLKELATMGLVRIPSASTVLAILHKRFGVRFKQANPQQLRY